MTENINNLVVFLADNFHLLGYGLAFFAALLETLFVVGLFLPGSTTILILGTFSAQGYLDFTFLFVFAVAGAIIGDNINYYIGNKYSATLLENGFWFLNKNHFYKAKIFFDKHGAKSVFLGRFIPSIKEIVPIIAGTLKMRRNKFLLWNILGAIGWGMEWLLLGYVFGQSLNLAKEWIFKIGISAMILLFVFTIGTLPLRFFYKKKWNT